jgi:phage terminase large subunit GpA-like protein
MEGENTSAENGSKEEVFIPKGAVALTIGADTQSDGFYYLLACWGRKMECWLPLTGRFVGDMRGEEVWQALGELLSTNWFDRDGNLYRPVRAALDIQGDFYPECLEYIRSRKAKCRLHAVRGYGGAKTSASTRSFGILRNVYLDKSTGVSVQNLDTDIGKSQLASMLARSEPGPGYVHLPCGPNGEEVGGWDHQAVAELTAEYRRETNVRGYKVERWFKRGDRANHRLDCFVYSLAALALSRLKIDDCELQRTEAKNVGTEPEKKEQPKWGAIYRAPLPGETNSWPKAPVGSVPMPQDKPRSRWGVQNRGVEW